MAVDFSWMIGLAVMFALALLLTYITYKDLDTFFVFLTIFCGFVVWGGLLDLWVLILMLVVLSIILLNLIRKRRFS